MRNMIPALIGMVQSLRHSRQRLLAVPLVLALLLTTIMASGGFGRNANADGSSPGGIVASTAQTVVPQAEAAGAYCNRVTYRNGLISCTYWNPEANSFRGAWQESWGNGYGFNSCNAYTYINGAWRYGTLFSPYYCNMYAYR